MDWLRVEASNEAICTKIAGRRKAVDLEVGAGIRLDDGQLRDDDLS